MNRADEIKLRNEALRVTAENGATAPAVVSVTLYPGETIADLVRVAYDLKDFDRPPIPISAYVALVTTINRKALEEQVKAKAPEVKIQFPDYRAFLILQGGIKVKVGEDTPREISNWRDVGLKVEIIANPTSESGQ